MGESIIEQIQAKVKTELAAIVGDAGVNYWYTPDKVTRVDEWHRNHLVETYGIIYLVSDRGDVNLNLRESALGKDARDLDVPILVAYQDKRDEKDPHRATTGSGTIRNRMLQDVTKKLNSDYKRGALAINTEIPRELRDFEEPAGWIVGELLATVTYDHEFASP